MSGVTGQAGGGLRAPDGTSVKSREFDSRLKQMQSERDQIQNGIRRIG